MSASLRAALGVALVTALVAPAGLARAQVDNTAAARELFREGLAHSDAEEWEDAAADFERAYGLRDAPQIAVNLAIALSHTGRLVRAVEMLHAAERHADADAAIRARAAELRAEIEPRLAHLTVRLTGATEAVSVSVDGHPLAAELIGVPFPADPGAHRVVATRGGAQVAEDSVELGEASDGAVSLAIAPAPADAVDPEGPGPTEAPGLGAGTDDGGSVLEEWWFWTLVGVVVAAGVLVPVLIVTQGDDGIIEGNGNPPVLRFEGAM